MYELDDMKANIAYVVMPPGHGKSYLHRGVKGFLEADTIVYCKGTEKLRTLRQEAKAVGEWDVYDAEWVRELCEALQEERRRVVVAVPSDEVGVRAGWTRLGGIVLEKSQWALNFAERKDSHHKHEQCWEEAHLKGAILARSNLEVERWVRAVVTEWGERREA